MTKALLKKQFMEIFVGIFHDQKKGKTRSKGGIAACVVLYLILFGFLGVVFYNLALSLSPLILTEFDWLYFSIMGLMAIILSVIGSTFGTYSTLYLAKDNDLLLSMPIPSRTIVGVRFIGVLLIGLLYELIVLVPTWIIWFAMSTITAPLIIGAAVVFVMIAVLVLVLSTLLGWVIALASSRIKRKNIASVILSLAFLALYFAVFSDGMDYVNAILLEPQSAASIVQGPLYPFYQMGLAAGGDWSAILIFSAIVLALFAVMFTVISRSFINLATARTASVKAKYTERTAKFHSADTALLIKELKRFTGSTTYMLNSAIGLAYIVAAGVAILIFGASLKDMLTELINGLAPADSELMYLLVAVIAFLLCSTVDITAPSVSMEGKNIWLAQSLPVTAAQALMAKVRLHIILTAVPAAFFVIAAEITFAPGLRFGIMLPVMVALYIVFSAQFGLVLNLKAPNLSWTNETVPLKQSLSVFVALFGGMGISIGLGALYFVLYSVLDPFTYSLILSALLLALSLLLRRWITTRGAKIFASL